MDDPVAPNGENVAGGEETVIPWMEEICHKRGDYLWIATYMSSEPFTDARALELARKLRSEGPISNLMLDVTQLSPTSEGTKELAAFLEQADIGKIEIELSGLSTDKSAHIYGVLLAALKGNQTLSSLSLSDCDALGDDLAAFVESRPANLPEIDLFNCHLADPYNPRLLRSIGRAAHDRYLTSFCFTEHVNNSQSAKAIQLSNFRGIKLSISDGEALPSNCIQNLVADCGDLHVSVSGRTPLVSIVSMHCSIEKLSLKGSSSCTLEDAHSLNVILRTQAGSLKELELNSWKMDLECWQVVLPGMVVCHSLSTLRMRFSKFSVSHRGAWIGRVLRSCPQLTTLSLDETLCDSDFISFIEYLRTNRMLKWLKLKWLKIRLCSIGFFDVLVDALRHNATLETLEILESDVADLTPLFRMLVDREIPTDLFLKRNRYVNRGWDALSDALDSGARLRKLCLDVNPVDDGDCLACIRFIRGMNSHPRLKEFELSWEVPRFYAPKGDLMECLISAIGSFQFLEKLSFEWIENAFGWDYWKDALLAAVKQNVSLVELSVDGVGDKDFKDWLMFYNRRNRVTKTVESSVRGLWGDMIFQLYQCPEKSVGMSVVFLAFKTHATLIETAGCSRSTKHPLAEEKEDSDKSSN